MADDKLSRLYAERDKVNAKIQRELARVQKRKRGEDTQLKILEGVTARYGMEHSEEYRRLHEQFRARALTAAKDRARFGLAPLPEPAARYKAAPPPKRNGHAAGEAIQ